MHSKQVLAHVIPLPPLAEQREVVRRVERLLKLVAAIETCLVAQRKRLEGLWEAIVAKAFRGELVATEAALARQEGRDYESASVLLERIRSNRATAAQKGAGKGQPKRRAQRAMPVRSRPGKTAVTSRGDGP